MSLYYETAAVLANADRAGGSLKARPYEQQGLKSAKLFALISEASQWLPVLKEVIERCGLLGEERKVMPRSHASLFGISHSAGSYSCWLCLLLCAGFLAW